MKTAVTIIGDGAMGTLCAMLLNENGCAVRLWSAFPEAAAELARARENRRFMPGCHLDSSIEITGDDSQAFSKTELVISAVPTQFMRPVWQRLKKFYPAGLSVCSVAKGIENHTLLRPTQILADILNVKSLAVLSGPSIAPEIAKKLPATVVSASTDACLAERVQAFFTRPYFRVYTNSDIVGVEVAGASKNVIAIAAGILDGLSAGVNAKAALLTRGITEITRLGIALGASAETFAGLAGMGDLVTTCFSPIGRNRSFGEAVGRGQTAEQALAATESVVEGAATTESLVQLAAKVGVEMPITQAVYDVLFKGKGPAQAIAELMKRPMKAES